MASLALLVLLLSSLQYAYAKQICTEADLCKPVKADICDNSKICKEVDIADINHIIQAGGTVHDWNILPEPFTTGCRYEVEFKPEPGSSVHYAVNGTLGAYIGASCTQLVSSSIIFSSDIDPSGGKLNILTGTMHGKTIQDCFWYMDRNAGFVYRRCVRDSTGVPCASIYSLELIDKVKVEDDSIHTFLKSVGVDISYDVSKCSP